MIDLAALPPAVTLDPINDLAFTAGNDNTPGAWSAAPAPTSITVRRGAGVNGSDRVTILWPDSAIQDRWLRVTVNATADTGLASPDVFYFGNLAGDTGNSTSSFTVTISDVALIRSLNGATAPVTSAADVNHSGQITVSDVAAPRAYNGHTLTLLTAPAAAPAAPATAPSPTIATAAAIVPPTNTLTPAALPAVAAAAPTTPNAVFSTILIPPSTAQFQPARKRNSLFDISQN